MRAGNDVGGGIFSTILYTGNDTSQTITNGIDLSGQGGLVWIKSRAGTYVRENYLYDTARGIIVGLRTDDTTAQHNNTPNGVSAYYSNGFNIVGMLGSGGNDSGTTYVSWTFRKATNFFDVVTYTGDGDIGRNISHSLGSAPGIKIMKRMASAGGWVMWTPFIANNEVLHLNETSPKQNYGNILGGNDTSSTFRVDARYDTNINGQTYVAYLFANDTTENGIIRVGSYTGNESTSGPSINLGWQPQWLMIKNTSNTGDWLIYDSARDNSNPRTYVLYANMNSAEVTNGPDIDFNPTGFQIRSTNGGVNTGSSVYIYLAIRDAVVRTPTVPIVFRAD